MPIAVIPPPIAPPVFVAPPVPSPPPPPVHAAAPPPHPHASPSPPAVPHAPPPSVDDEGAGEPTRPIQTPNAAALVDEIVELMASEAEALLTAGTADGADADERLADLNVRLSLITWDVLEDPDDSARYLELAEKHPLAPRLLLSHAIAGATAAQLDAAQSVVDAVPDARERQALLRDAAEAWLYRLGDPRKAAAAAGKVVDAGGDAELVADARHLLHLAWAAGDDWAPLTAAAVQVVSGAAITAPDDLATAAALTLDRRADAAAALELVLGALARSDKAIERARGTSAAIHWLRVVDLALDAAAQLGDGPRRIELLERRAAILDGDPAAAREAAASRLLAALDRAQLRDPAALAALGKLALVDGDATGFGPRAARLAAAHAATAAGKGRDAALARRELAREPGAGALAAAHAWRASEQADAASPADPTLALEPRAAPTSWPAPRRRRSRSSASCSPPSLASWSACSRPARRGSARSCAGPPRSPSRGSATSRARSGSCGSWSTIAPAGRRA